MGHFFWLWKSQENVHRLRLQPDEPSAGSFRKNGPDISFSNLDAYLNVVGGLRLDEPAADLAVAMALVSV